MQLTSTLTLGVTAFVKYLDAQHSVYAVTNAGTGAGAHHYKPKSLKYITMSFYEFKHRLCNIVQKVEKLKEINISHMLSIFMHIRTQNEQPRISILI